MQTRPRLPLRLALVLPFVLPLLAACSGGEPVVFTHGVASGDALPDGAVLWTRIDREAELTVEVATDPGFTDVNLEEKVRAEEARDFTTKIEVSGLETGRPYYYRFRKGDDVSPVGTFRTAPEPDNPEGVSFVFSGDSDGTVGEDGARPFDFQVLDAMRREEADFFLYIGDTIYADSTLGPRALSLEAYRAKHKTNREVDRLRELLASTASYAIWGDRDVQDDFAGEAANAEQSVSAEQFAAGLQAFREYLPIGGDDRPETLYRSFRWGQDVEIIILDERSFRVGGAAAACTPAGASAPDLLPALGAPGVPDPYRNLRASAGLPPNTEAACLAALNDPNRTMLGNQQLQALFDVIQESDATFKFIVNEVPVSELVTLPYDRWEGYRAERDDLLRFIGNQGRGNIVFLSTDLHASVISDVRVNLASLPVAVEAITGPIADRTLGDTIAETQGEPAVGLFEQLLGQVTQPECVEFDASSYGLVEVDPDARTATITLKDQDGRQLCQRVLPAQ